MTPTVDLEDLQYRAVPPPGLQIDELRDDLRQVDLVIILRVVVARGTEVGTEGAAVVVGESGPWG